MKYLKLFFFFAFCFTLTLSLSACNSKNDKPNNTEEDKTTEIEEPQEEQYKIYKLALKSGFNGTYEEWLDSIKGDKIVLKVEDNKLLWKYSEDKEYQELIDLNDLVNDNLENKETHTVKFVTGTDLVIEDQKITDGKLVNKVEEPQKSGYKFTGWYVDNEKWIFNAYPVLKDLTLEARFVEVPKETTFTMDDVTVTYDEDYHTITLNEELPEGLAMKYVGEYEFIDSGTYGIVIMIYGDNFETQLVNATLTIEAQIVDTSIFEFPEVTYDYDGEGKEPAEVLGLLEGMYVEYDLLSVSKVGVHDVTATITCINPNFVLENNILKSKIIINKAHVDMSEVEILDEVFEYDGNPHELTVSNLPDFVFYETIIKSNGREVNECLEVGTYEITYNFDPYDEGYYDIKPITRTLKIIKPTVVTNHAFLLTDLSDFKASEEFEMLEISLEDLKVIDPKSAQAFEANKTPIKSIHFFPNHQVTSDAGWKFTANGKEYNGGHVLKLGFGEKRVAWNNSLEQYVTSCEAKVVIPEAKTAHAESLTPETYFVPKWVEKPFNGENIWGWADNPAIIAPDGNYNIVLVTYDRESTSKDAGYGIGVYVASKDTVRVTGERNGWATSEAIMSEITLDELKALNNDLGLKVQNGPNKPVGIYKYENQLFQNVKNYYFLAKYYNGREVIEINPGYTVKVINFNETVMYDDYYKKVIRVPSVTDWLPDANNHVANLTPESLFIPNWVDEAPVGQDHLGDWYDMPVVTAGSGLYTVIYVDYGAKSTSQEATGGLAVIKTKNLEEEFAPEKEALKAALALGDQKDDNGNPLQSTLEYTLTGKVVAYNKEWNEKDQVFKVNMIIDVNGIKFSVWSAQTKEDGRFTYPKKEESLNRLGVDTRVKVTGKVENTKKVLNKITSAATFYKGHIEWDNENTYGVVGDFNNWAMGDVKDIIMTKGADGKYRVTVELKASNHLKVRMNYAWNKHWGVGVDGKEDFVASENGSYLITLDLTTDKLTIVKVI